MFTVVKVREGLAAGDYKDPGWFEHPKGTVAYEVEGPAAAAPRQSSPASPNAPAQVVKPKGHKGH